MNDFVLKNVPPGDPRLDPKYAYLGFKVCPHFAIIEICSSLAGIDLTENKDEFCGQKVTDQVIQRGFHPTVTGGTYSPDTACLRATDKLRKMLKDANNKVYPPDPRPILPKKEILEATLKQTIEYENQTNAIEQFRQGLHKQNIITPEDNLNEEEIIKKVEYFYQTLLQLIVGNKQTYWHKIENCEVSPEYRDSIFF